MSDEPSVLHLDDGHEEDVCRVCRLEEDEDNPMVHPCKCSGSVRFVHPDCLKSWLATSQKKHCEICGYRYTFTKIYPDFIPSFIPPTVYIRQSIRYIYRAALYVHRCWMVIVAWLVVLPIANMGGLKAYRWVGDFFLVGLTSTYTAGSLGNTTMSANNNTNANVNATLQELAVNASSSLLSIPNRTTSELLEVVLISQLGPGVRLVKLAWQTWKSHRNWPFSSFSSANVTTNGTSTAPPAQLKSFLFASSFNAPSPYYIFQGQVLTVALAALIVALIFLREWFTSYDWTQHDRPEEEAEEEIDPDEWMIHNGQATQVFKRGHRRKSLILRLEKNKEKGSKQREVTAEEIQQMVELAQKVKASKEKVKEKATLTVPNGLPTVELDKDDNDPFIGQGGIGMARYPSAPPEDVGGEIPPAMTRSTSSPSVQKQHQAIESLLTPTSGLMPPPLIRKHSKLESSPSSPSSMSASISAPTANENTSTSASAEAGPGPSTLAARLSPPTSPTTRAREFLREAEVMRQARSRLAEGRTESSTWKAPELLVNKGKGRAVDPQVSKADKEASGEGDTGGARRSPASRSPITSARSLPVSSRHPSLALDTIAVAGTEEHTVSAESAGKGAAVIGNLETGADASRFQEDEQDPAIPHRIAAESSEGAVHNGRIDDALQPCAIIDPTLSSSDIIENGPADKVDPARESLVDALRSDSGSGITISYQQSPGAPANPDDVQVLRMGTGAGTEQVQAAAAVLEDPRRKRAAMRRRREKARNLVGQLHMTLAKNGISSGEHNGGITMVAREVWELDDLELEKETLEWENEAARLVLLTIDLPGTRVQQMSLADLEAERKAKEGEEGKVGDKGENGEGEVVVAVAVGDAVGEVGVVGAEEVDEVDEEEGEGEAEEAGEDEQEEEEEVVFEDEIDGEDVAWGADDWDQILEVIGLIGPYSALLQNLILAIAIMGGVIAIFIDIPFTTGKALLAIDPIRSFLGTINLTWWCTRWFLWAVRYVVDPVFDIVWEIAREVLLKPSLGAFWAAEKILASKLGMSGGDLAIVGAGQSDIGERLRQFASWVQIPDTHQMELLTATEPLVIHLPGFVTSRIASLPATLIIPTDPTLILDGLEILGNKSYRAYEAYREVCIKVAASDTLGNSVLCIAIGYLATISLLTTLAWMGESGRVKVSEGWKSGLRQFRLTVKLATFLGLELIAFPFFVGTLMTLCTLPLFPQIPLWEKIEQMRGIAFGMVFITWLVGTMFMYGFAQILSWARSYCRSGALYFIRDPHDPKYSPVKEMIERPTRSQFHKLGMSTVMYAFLVWWLFGAVPWGMRLLLPKFILPLWLDDKYGPLTPIPFDYLFLLLAVPPTIRKIRPQHTIKKLLGQYWKTSARILRIDILLYGNPSNSPPTTPGRIESLIFSILDIPFRLLFGPYQSEATLARVPAQDKVVLLTSNPRKKRQGMFIPLNARGQPKNPADKLRLLRQDAYCRKAGRDPATDFAMLHLPEKWRTRIHCFILSLLGGAAAALGLFVLAPVVLGREMLKSRFGEVHDGYSFLIGAYTIYGLILVGSRLRRFVVSLNRADHRRIATRQTRIKRSILGSMRKAIAVVLVYLVHPVLRGMMWEIRLGLMVRYGMGQASPVIHLWDAWALGAVLNSIELKACGLFGRPRAADAHRIHNLWRHPFQHRLRGLIRILLPEFGLMVVKIALPFLMTIALGFFGEQDDQARAVHFRLSGLSTWAMYAGCVRARKIAGKIVAVRQSMIDAEYVMEERVDNYEPEPEAEPTLGSVEKAQADLKTALLVLMGDKNDLGADRTGAGTHADADTAVADLTGATPPNIVVLPEGLIGGEDAKAIPTLAENGTFQLRRDADGAWTPISPVGSDTDEEGDSGGESDEEEGKAVQGESIQERMEREGKEREIQRGMTGDEKRAYQAKLLRRQLRRDRKRREEQKASDNDSDNDAASISSRMEITEEDMSPLVDPNQINGKANGDAKKQIESKRISLDIEPRVKPRRRRRVSVSLSSSNAGSVSSRMEITDEDMSMTMGLDEYNRMVDDDAQGMWEEGASESERERVREEGVEMGGKVNSVKGGSPDM